MFFNKYITGDDRHPMSQLFQLKKDNRISLNLDQWW